MTHDDRSDDPDQAYDRDGAQRARGDWWTALTDWLAARPPRTAEHGEHRPTAPRGPDGQTCYGCVIPPGAVPTHDVDDIDGADNRFRAHRERHEHADDAASGDLTDDGTGW